MFMKQNNTRRDCLFLGPHRYNVNLTNICFRAMTVRLRVTVRPSVRLYRNTEKRAQKIRISKILLRAQRSVIISCRHYNKSEIKKHETKKVYSDTKLAVRVVPPSLDSVPATRVSTEPHMKLTSADVTL